MTDTHIVQTKTCTWCHEDKPRCEYHANRSRKDGLAAYCKACCSVRQVEYRARVKLDSDKMARRREANRVWRASPKGRATSRAYRLSETGRAVERASKRKAKYGLTPEEFEVMRLLQNNRCATCSDEFDPKHINVDHCHITGRVRGLLCMHCNRGLGAVRDRVETLEAMIRYLQEHSA